MISPRKQILLGEEQRCSGRPAKPDRPTPFDLGRQPWGTPGASGAAAGVEDS